MRTILSLFVFLVTLLLCMAFLYAVEPDGASIIVGSSSRPLSGNASNHSAFAGNITLLTISTGSGATQSWQGYFGSVSGGLKLADATDSVLYNWSVVNPEGEVYASTNSTILWPHIQCFNLTANGTYNDESGNGGTTNLYGTNVTQLESTFNVDSSDLDSVNYTFSSFNHDSFFSASQEFAADECPSAQLFTNNSQSEDGLFEEVLLYEPVTASVVYTSILEESANGFNGSAIDFEMMVLEDGHGADTATTTYFFFVEIE